MRTAIYIRVSTEEQVNEGYSISAQRERLQAYAVSQSWDVVGFYVDEGISAKNTERPQLQRMISHIEEGFIDVVLVYRLDRLTRSVLDLYKLLDIFEQNNCKFKSATEVYDTTTAMGRLFITLVAALAQWERENLGERVTMGMLQRAREGQWKGGPPAYGYNYIDNEMSIDEEKAETVRWIFDSYINGQSDRKIAIKLNEMGIITAKNVKWREGAVKRILLNETYTGKLRYGVRSNKENAFNVDGAMPQIIDQEIFDKAQEVRAGRRNVHSRVATSEHIFSGVLRCARCGGALKGHKKTDNGKHYRSYRCLNRLNKTCDLPMISQKLLEDKFISHFNEIDVVGEYKPPQKVKLKTVDKIEKELESIKKRRKKWQYAWANELMSDEEYTDRIREEQAKEEELSKSLEEQQEPVNTAQEIGIIAKFIEENWEELEVHEKKTFVLNMIDKMVLDKVDVKKMKDRIIIKELRFK